MTNRRSNQLLSWFLGAILPTIVLTLGVGAVLVLGTQKPNQIIEDLSDPRIQLMKMPIVSVDTIQPYEGLESLDVELSGTVVPYRQITLAAEIAGRVLYKSDECRIGRYVHTGDVLFRIDPKDYEFEVERLTALKESEYAQQKELDQELANSNLSLELANEELALQEGELARMESLPAGFASATEMDQVKRQRITSANQVVSIQNQLRLLETRRTRIQLAERLASAQLSQALVNLERAEVTSPISGVIVSETIQADSYVQKGSSLCVIEDTERVEVSCNLRTDQLLLILDQASDVSAADASSRIVQSASYELPKTPVKISYRVAGREDVVYQWHGHLSRYEGIGLDAQSRTVPIRIMVENPRDVRRNGEAIQEDSNGGLPALVRGMFVDVAIMTHPKQSLLLIPKLAIKPGGVVWRFNSEPDMLISTAVKPDPKVTVSDRPSGAKSPSIADSQTNADSAGNLRLTDWEAGKLQTVSGVKTISLVRLPGSSVEYWVAEACEGLAPGTRAIVSPLANVLGDGSDRVRLSVKNRELGGNSE